MAAPRRPLVYDVTYVVARLDAPTPTGIERVDAAFARRFAGPDGSIAAALHYGLARPHLLSPPRAAALVRRADAAWHADGAADADPVFRAVAAWLASAPRPAGAIRAAPRKASPLAGFAQLAGRTRWRLATSRDACVPPDALYLNIAQYAFEYPLVFRWLDRRPDVKPVFFIHDLLPLDRPEFFRAGYEALFERRVRTMARYAAAVLVSSQVVADRVAHEMAARGRSVPILAAPLPPPAEAEPSRALPPASAAPYFVALGTIEPRKNQLLLLNVWRDLAAGPGPIPRLVLIGARGWDNEQVVDMLERCRQIAPHVIEVSGLSTTGLRRLIAGARALLSPSFDEGYGLPLAEALAAGTPVVASDIPVFREVSQGQAMRLDPTDGPGWRGAVQGMTAPDSDLRARWAAAAAHYWPPTWPDYFARVDAFLATL